MSFGTGELGVIFLIIVGLALVVIVLIKVVLFAVRRLAQLGGGMGKGIRDHHRWLRDDEDA